MSWVEWAQSQCEEVRAAGRWRMPCDFDLLGPTGTQCSSGRTVVSFASNDYLGLTSHPKVVAAAHEALSRWGAGAGSARLIVGSRPVHTELESKIALWKGVERAALFPTGYQANLGVLTTLARRDTVVCSDELNHASIIDACRLSGAEVRIFPHRDVDALEDLLEGTRRAIVVTDAVFSMDGDLAPLDDIIDVCRRHGALLVVDEAHAVLGPETLASDVLKVGTLSKFLGALGGYVAGPRPLVELIVNRARPYIFTTALPPAVAASALAALELLRSQEGHLLKKRLRALIDRVDSGRPTPIVPVVLGDESTAVSASEALLERGLLVPAIRPPSVPPGTARLRVTITAAHTFEHVDALATALQEIRSVEIDA